MGRKTALGRHLPLLAVAFLISGLAAALAACGSSASTLPPAVAPSNAQTIAQAAATPAPPSSDSAPVLIPTPSDDDGLEFVMPDSVSSAGKSEGSTSDDRSPSQKSGTSEGPVQGQPYTWEDGDSTHTVYLQTDLVVEADSDGLTRDVVEAAAGGSNVVRSAEAQSKGGTLPVFRSESGELMTLPGGVLLVLDPKWSESQVNSFFSDNGIKLDRVSELSYAANGFFIETDPGFPSLDLANALAGLDGVEVSSPNWGREAVPK